VLLDPARTAILGSPVGVTISGNGRTRVFEVGFRNQPATTRLVDLTIAHGRAEEGEIEGGTLGGGVLCRSGSTLEMVGCTIRDNSARDGGGVFNFRGKLIMTNCTLARNRAMADGGGVRVYGNTGTAILTHCTFLDNVAGTGGGLHTHGGSETVVYNCLFAGNPGGDAVNAVGHAQLSGGSNVFSDGSNGGSDDLVMGINHAIARVGTLGRYGGPTETVPLLTDSPALDTGDASRISDGLNTDQRGLPLVVNGKVDIGAFEVQ
jgi:hypothetical protein